MPRLLTLAAVLAATCLTLPAQAALIDARFSGTVDAQNQSGSAVGATVSGEFVYDTVSASYLSFSVAGLSVAAGYASTASLTPDLSTALYRAQLSPVSGAATNSRTASSHPFTGPARPDAWPCPRA